MADEEQWSCSGCGAPPPFLCDCVTNVAFEKTSFKHKRKEDFVNPSHTMADAERLARLEAVLGALIGYLHRELGTAAATKLLTDLAAQPGEGGA